MYFYSLYCGYSELEKLLEEMKMKKLIAFLTAALLLFSSAAFADTLVMGTNAEFPPFEFIGDDGVPTGFDVELMQLIAEEMGKELVIENMFFDGLIAALTMGDIECIAAAMTITTERQLAVNFSTPYFNATQAVIVMKGYDGIATIDDLLDKKIAVQDATTGHFLVADDLGVDAANISSFKAAPDAILELMNGRADCIVIDNAVAANFLTMFDELEIIQELEMPVEEYGIAVAMENVELLEAINAALAKVIEDGKYDELIEKYFMAAE
jgi:polar amino acid transport system substrate-binding protein